MARMTKVTQKKNAMANEVHKTKHNNNYYSKEKSSHKKEMLQHLIHPDYVLFDWEFFSNQLEFE